MISVHHYHQPFALLPASHGAPTRRHNDLVIERGRSRAVSQAALARRRSEERKRAAFSSRLALQSSASTPRVVFSQTSKSRAASHRNSGSESLGNASPVASSSACRLPSPLACSRISERVPELAVPAPESTAGPSDSCSRNGVTESCSTSVAEASSPFGEAEEVQSAEDALSVEEQMQQAYAACQTVHGTPGKNHCRCRNMHRARILYLKTQGIDVTSDNDPRINQVRDEDFVFVPGGEVVLDEESLAAINEERERREKQAQARKQRACGMPSNEHAPVSTAVVSQRCGYELNLAPQSSHALEFRSKKTRPLGKSGLSKQYITSYESTESSRTSGSSTGRSCRTYQTDIIGTQPFPVSPGEIERSVHGSLFQDSGPPVPRSPSQDRLLNTLLEPVLPWGTDCQRAIKQGKLEAGRRKWPYNQGCQSSETVNSCIACSASSDLTISRTNSWASAASGVSSSTCNTSPSSSPRLSKLQLVPLIEDKIFREQIKHSCRLHRRSRLTVVPLSDAPLRFGGNGREQSAAHALRGEFRQHKENVASVLVSRVKQSVSGLVDFASKMQQSYLRTIQFASALPPADASSLSKQSSMRAMWDHSPCKPSGYRACASDVRQFAPYPVSGPARDLNLPSDLNIPLAATHHDEDASVRSRVFAPLAFVPPSPLRPREAPPTPEWRLRPVANPCTLRLKAHANCLNEKGIAWEGRAHTGSLGCGRERLTGVAFEGLGGSRLAFEAK